MKDTNISSLYRGSFQLSKFKAKWQSLNFIIVISCAGRWTPHSLHRERIQYDNEFVNSVIPKLCFLHKSYSPKVLCGTRKEDKELSTSGTDSSEIF